jgi:hypothetical protein
MLFQGPSPVASAQSLDITSGTCCGFAYSIPRACTWTTNATTTFKNPSHHRSNDLRTNKKTNNNTNKPKNKKQTHSHKHGITHITHSIIRYPAGKRIQTNTMQWDKYKIRTNKQSQQHQQQNKIPTLNRNPYQKKMTKTTKNTYNSTQ